MRRPRSSCRPKTMSGRSVSSSRLATLRLVALSGIDDKPEELLVTALVRARMCELLAEAYRERDRDAFFTTGMFSVIDALIDSPMAEVLTLLPLADDLKRAPSSGQEARAMRCAACSPTSAGSSTRPGTAP